MAKDEKKTGKKFYRVRFHERTNETEPINVALGVNGNILVCKRGEEVILPEEYVRLATTKRIENANEAALARGDLEACSGYGYQMWMCSWPGAYRADGAAGQFSIVIPDKDMIIAMNQNAPGGNPNKVIQKLWECLMPSVENEAILPDSTGKTIQEKLSYRMKHLAISAPEFKPYAAAKASASGTYQAVS